MKLILTIIAFLCFTASAQAQFTYSNPFQKVDTYSGSFLTKPGEFTESDVDNPPTKTVFTYVPLLSTADSHVVNNFANSEAWGGCGAYAFLQPYFAPSDGYITNVTLLCFGHGRTYLSGIDGRDTSHNAMGNGHSKVTLNAEPTSGGAQRHKFAGKFGLHVPKSECDTLVGSMENSLHDTELQFCRAIFDGTIRKWKLTIKTRNSNGTMGPEFTMTPPGQTPGQTIQWTTFFYSDTSGQGTETLQVNSKAWVTTHKVNLKYSEAPQEQSDTISPGALLKYDSVTDL